MRKKSLAHGVWSVILAVSLVTAARGAEAARAHSAVATGPILIVTNNTPTAPFGTFIGEILRTEGLPEFDVVALSALTAGDLADHAVTILAETPLTPAEATLFNNYANNGGRLIAMRPDAQIAALFGLGAVGVPATIDAAYMRINSNAVLDGFAPGIGLTTESLQTHGPADQYQVNLAQATVAATLYSNADIATEFPAVVLAKPGIGRVAAFTYDLARSIAYLRQGNPANADVNVDGNFWVPGQPLFNVPDLFQTQGTTATLWIDRNRMSIPQADMQQRMFARIVRYLALSGGANSVPLPQLWYLPNSARTALVLTSNNYAGDEVNLNDIANSAKHYGGTVSFLMALGTNNQLSEIQALSLAAQGHEFGILPTAYKPDPFPPFNVASLVEGYPKVMSWFTETYSALTPSMAARNVRLAWSGWAGGAEEAAKQGLKMDLSYTGVGTWLQRPDGTWPHGYLNGSGQPMRFVKQDGTIVPVFQQGTNLIDVQMLDIIDDFGYEGLTPEQAFDVSRRLIDNSLNRDHATLVLETQSEFFYPLVREWVTSTLQYAKANNVLLLNAGQWAQFVDVRNSAQFVDIAFDTATTQLTFTLQSTQTQGVTLTVQLPLVYSGGSLTHVSVDGQPVPHIVTLVNGINVAFVNVPAGQRNFVATYTPDTQLIALNASNNSPQYLYRPVLFTANATGSNPSYLWDFGDGTLGGGSVISHTYTVWQPNGIYTATVIASNGANSISRTVTVQLILPSQTSLPYVGK